MLKHTLLSCGPKCCHCPAGRSCVGHGCRRGRSSAASSGRTGRSRRPGFAFFTNSTSSLLPLSSLLLSTLLLPSLLLLPSPPVATCREVRTDGTWSGDCGHREAALLVAWHIAADEHSRRACKTTRAPAPTCRKGPHGEGGRASPWPLQPPCQRAAAGSSTGQAVLIAWLAAAASPPALRSSCRHVAFARGAHRCLADGQYEASKGDAAP